MIDAPCCKQKYLLITNRPWEVFMSWLPYEHNQHWFHSSPCSKVIALNCNLLSWFGIKETNSFLLNRADSKLKRQFIHIPQPLHPLQPPHIPQPPHTPQPPHLPQSLHPLAMASAPKSHIMTCPLSTDWDAWDCVYALEYCSSLSFLLALLNAVFWQVLCKFARTSTVISIIVDDGQVCMRMDPKEKSIFKIHLCPWCKIITGWGHSLFPLPLHLTVTGLLWPPLNIAPQNGINLQTKDPAFPLSL